MGATPALPLKFSQLKAAWDATENNLATYVISGSLTPSATPFAGIGTLAAGLKLSQFASLQPPRHVYNVTDGIYSYADNTTLRDNDMTSYTISLSVIQGMTSYNWVRTAGANGTISNSAIYNPTFTGPAGTWSSTYRVTMVKDSITYYSWTFLFKNGGL